MAMARDRTSLIALLGWALMMIVPDLVRIVQPLGSLGFYASGDGLIYDVQGPFPNRAASPAFNAGIRAGDRIDLAAMRCIPYDAQRCASVLAALGGVQYILPGRAAIIDLAATPEREKSEVTLVASERPSNWLVRVVLLLDGIAGILVLAGAAWLVWTHPGRMSWGFFLYVVWFNPGQSFAFYAFLQQWPFLLLAQDVAACLAQGAAYAGLLLFVMRVPNDTPDPDWRRFERVLPLLGFVLAFALLASYGNAFGYRTESVSRAALLAGFAVDAAALVVLLLRRRNQTPEDYQRMRWVIWGCAIGLPAFIVAELAQDTTLIGNLWGTAPPYDLLGLLFLANGVFCLFVVEAIRRSRVVSVAIPLRRVTLLGLTLSIPALLLHDEVERIHGALDIPDWAWLVIAVLLLYLISRLHEFAVDVTDRYFNRRLDRAEAVLAQAMLRAQHAEGIDRILAEGPFRAIELASAATFRRDGDGFDRHDSGNGWDDSEARTLQASDPMLRALSGGAPFDLSETTTETRLPSGLGRPILAIPAVNRVRCFALVLYGPHASGTDLDSNERAMLARLADRAADCYAELESAELRARIVALENKLSARTQHAEPDNV